MLNQSPFSPTGFPPITAENEDRCAKNPKGSVVEEAILCYCKSPPAWAENNHHVYLILGTTLFFAIIAVILYSMLHRQSPTPLIYRKMMATTYGTMSKAQIELLMPLATLFRMAKFMRKDVEAKLKKDFPEMPPMSVRCNNKLPGRRYVVDVRSALVASSLFNAILTQYSLAIRKNNKRNSIEAISTTATNRIRPPRTHARAHHHTTNIDQEEGGGVSCALCKSEKQKYLFAFGQRLYGEKRRANPKGPRAPVWVSGVMRGRFLSAECKIADLLCVFNLPPRPVLARSS